MFDSLRDNEFNDLVKLGWIEEGTVGDAGKFKLSAKGLAEYDRLVESLAAKQQVLATFKTKANAFALKADVKKYMN